MTRVREPATHGSGVQVLLFVLAVVAGWFLFSLLGSLVIQGWPTALATAVGLGAAAYWIRPSSPAAMVVRGFVLIFAIVGLASALLQLTLVSD